MTNLSPTYYKFDNGEKNQGEGVKIELKVKQKKKMFTFIIVLSSPAKIGNKNLIMLEIYPIA